jgi:hypothetical protein
MITEQELSVKRESRKYSLLVKAVTSSSQLTGESSS